MGDEASQAKSHFQNGIPARYILTILGFFGFVLNYMLRVNMSIAIVAMVKGNGNEGNGSDDGSSSNEEGEFDWDDTAQSLITGAFFWGYIFTQIPGGRLAELYGSKYIFGFSIFLSGIVTLLVPWVAEDDPLKLICLRFILGLLEGATYPAMHVLISKWSPPNTERCRITAIIYSGAQAGTVLTLPMVGAIISRWGWRPAFYLMGTLPIIWMAFWILFAFDTPQSHPRIGSRELKYLEDSLPAVSHEAPNNVPWLKILTSSPCYAIVVSGFASNWGFWTLLTLLPTYMKTMLHYDIKQNSLLTAIPYLAMWFFGIAYAWVADYLRSSGTLSTVNVRKLSGIICLGIPAIALFGVTFVGTDPLLTLLLFTLGVGLSGAKYASYMVNHLDIAPNYAGTLLGLDNAINTIPGWLGPLVASMITGNVHVLERWHEVFYIASAVQAVGCGYYLIFASADVQPWNDNNEGSSQSKIRRNSGNVSYC